MRTLDEIDAERSDVYRERQALNQRLRQLDQERNLALAGLQFVKLDTTERDAFVARVEAEESAKAAEAARIEAERLAAEEAARKAAEEAAKEPPPEEPAEP